MLTPANAFASLTTPYGQPRLTYATHSPCKHDMARCTCKHAWPGWQVWACAGMCGYVCCVRVCMRLRAVIRGYTRIMYVAILLYIRLFFPHQPFTSPCSTWIYVGVCTYVCVCTYVRVCVRACAHNAPMHSVCGGVWACA